MDDPDVEGGAVDPDFPGGCTGDPYYADVQLLLHGQGANNSTVFTDSSSYARTVSIGAGTPKISTTQSKFDGASIRGGSHPTQLNVTLSGITADEAWTLELWYYRTASTDYQAFLEVDETYVMLRTPNNSGNFELGFFKTWMRTYTTAVVPLNTWTHLACCVEKTSPTNWRVRLFVNGTLEITYNTSDSLALSTGSPTLRIGRSNSSGFAAFDGYIDEYRLTVGVARYSSSFTPPTLPGCNGTGDISPINRSGTEALRGIGMTVNPGTLGLASGHKKLSGQEATAGAGSVSLFSPNKTAALIGQGVAVSDGTFITGDYPQLIRFFVRRVIRLDWQGVPITYRVFFNSDGTCTQQIDSGPVTAFIDPYWAVPSDGLTNEQTKSIPVSSVSNAFRQRNTKAETTSAGTIDLQSNTTMAGGCVLTVVRNRHPADAGFFSVAFVPTTLNPRYRELGYYGILTLSVGT